MRVIVIYRNLANRPKYNESWNQAHWRHAFWTHLFLNFPATIYIFSKNDGGYTPEPPWRERTTPSRTHPHTGFGRALRRFVLSAVWSQSMNVFQTRFRLLILHNRICFVETRNYFVQIDSLECVDYGFRRRNKFVSQGHVSWKSPDPPPGAATIYLIQTKLGRVEVPQNVITHSTFFNQTIRNWNL